MGQSSVPRPCECGLWRDAEKEVEDGEMQPDTKAGARAVRSLWAVYAV